VLRHHSNKKSMSINCFCDYLVWCLQEAGWGIASFARAAELLKHSWPGWAASGVECRFLAWLDALIMPQLDHEMLNRLPLANW
jgi:hypothetical protein